MNSPLSDSDLQVTGHGAARSRAANAGGTTLARRPGHAVRIVHVCRQFWPAIGGMEAVVEALARLQAKNGHTVSVVTLDRVFGQAERLPATDQLGPIAVRRLPFKGSRRYPVAPGVLRHLRDADVVHVHGIDFFFDFLALTKPLHRRPLVVSTHGGFFHTQFASRLKQLYFNTVTRLSLTQYGFTAASSAQDEQLFAKLRRSGLAMVENGVDVDKFADTTADSAAKTLIYFGRLADNKRVDLLIPLLAALRRRDPDWRLIIAGRPMDDEVARLTALAVKADLAGAVEIVDTPTTAELRDLIGRSSVYVCASEYEGFGLAAVEAISAGLLPALSAIAPFRRTVDRTGIGALIDFDRPDEAAEGLETAWRAWNTEPRIRAEIQAAVSQFGWTGMEAQLAKVYDAVMGRGTRDILGVRTQTLTMDEACDHLDAALDRGGLKVAFANANLLNLVAKDDALRLGLRGFLMLNDGIGVDLASRLLYGRTFPANLAGTDFLPHYLDQSRHPLRIYMLGATQDSLDKAVAHLSERWPRHTVVGSRNGYFAPEAEALIVDEIRAAAPNLVLVAMGNPAQEKWIARHGDQLPAVVMAVGALFDFWAQAVPRAPDWVRAMRCEWVFRLMQEPGRLWRRYLIGNFVFLGHAFAQWVGGARAEMFERRRSREPG